MKAKADAELQDAIEQYEESSEAWSDARTQWLDDMRFARLGEQWPESVKRERERDGRPCLTINRMPSFIRQVVNDGRLNKPAIKVHGVDGQADKQTADVLSDLIRHIEASSASEIAYDTALEHAVSGGFGFFRVNIAYATDDAFEQDLKIEAISNPLTVLWDAASTAADASDWRYAFVSDDMPIKAFEATYKGAKAVDWKSNDYRGMGGAGWASEHAVRVAEWWTRTESEKQVFKLSNGLVMSKDDLDRVIDGVPQVSILQAMGLQIVGDRMAKSYTVRQRLITGAEVLKDITWSGCHIPICPVYGEDIIVDGQRHFISLTRQSKDAQRNFNYWRSSATEMVALAPKAPFIGPKGAFNSDQKKWASANTKSHPYIEYDGPMAPQRQQFAGVAAGALQEAANASDDMKSIMGLYDASLGARSNETSGIAINARKREGDVSTFHFIDNLSRGIAYGGRCLVELIPKVYNTPRMLRVIGQDNTQRTVQVNTEGTMDLTVGKYDVTVTAGPGFTTRREEAMQSMLEMMRVYPPAAPLLGDLIASAADWPQSDEVAKRLKAMLPPHILQAEQAGLPPEAQAVIGQMTQQLQQMQAQMQQMGQQRQQEMQAYQAMEAENQLLKVQNANKQGELQVRQGELGIKSQEIQLKGQTEMAKAQAGVEEERIRALADEMVARIEAASQAMQAPIQQMHERVMQPQPEPPDPGDAAESAVQAMTLQLLAKLSAPKSKTITIKAPSGKIYQAVVGEDSVQIATPGGTVMGGTIE